MSTVFIGEDVIIDKMNPQIDKIGDRCLIAAGVKIFTHYVDTKNLSNHESYHFRFYDGNVIIEEDVFIGANAVIAKPVKIGKGSIIGANSVVNKSTEEYSINVGAPSIKIKNRNWFIKMKLGIIIFSRLSSTRFKGKALKKINKCYILEIIYRRLLKATKKTQDQKLNIKKISKKDITKNIRKQI